MYLFCLIHLLKDRGAIIAYPVLRKSSHGMFPFFFFATFINAREPELLSG